MEVYQDLSKFPLSEQERKQTASILGMTVRELEELVKAGKPAVFASARRTGRHFAMECLARWREEVGIPVKRAEATSARPALSLKEKMAYESQR